MSQSLPWQVVTIWLEESGREAVRIAAFSTFSEARHECSRLAALLGGMVGEQVLKSVELTGNYRKAWWQFKQ